MIATSDFLVSLICLVHFEFGNSLDFRVAFAPIVWKISSKSFGNEFAQVVILPALGILLGPQVQPLLQPAKEVLVRL